MKNLFYILIFYGSAIFLPVKAENLLEERCRQVAGTPQVSIYTSYGKLKYDHTKVNRTLTRLHKKQYGGEVLNGYEVHGLATYDLATELNFKMYKNVFEDGSVCFYPDEIELTIGIQNPVIYISKSLKEKTCAYNVALRHEQTHQQINVEVLEQYLPRIQQVFSDVVKAHPVAVRPKDDVLIETAQESLKQRYLKALAPVLQQMQETASAEQKKLDRKEHYDYEQTLCP